MTTVNIDPELNNEIFEAAQAVRLLGLFTRVTEQPVMVFHTEGKEPTWTVGILGYMYVGRTLLEALQMANPLLEQYQVDAGRKA